MNDADLRDYWKPDEIAGCLDVGLDLEEKLWDIIWDDHIEDTLILNQWQKHIIENVREHILTGYTITEALEIEEEQDRWIFFDWIKVLTDDEITTIKQAIEHELTTDTRGLAEDYNQRLEKADICSRIQLIPGASIYQQIRHIQKPAIK